MSHIKFACHFAIQTWIAQRASGAAKEDKMTLNFASLSQNWEILVSFSPKVLFIKCVIPEYTSVRTMTLVSLLTLGGNVSHWVILAELHLTVKTLTTSGVIRALGIASRKSL